MITVTAIHNNPLKCEKEYKVIDHNRIQHLVTITDKELIENYHRINEYLEEKIKEQHD